MIILVTFGTLEMIPVRVPSFWGGRFFSFKATSIPMHHCAVVEKKIDNEFAGSRFPIDIFKVSCFILSSSSSVARKSNIFFSVRVKYQLNFFQILCLIVIL